MFPLPLSIPSPSPEWRQFVLPIGDFSLRITSYAVVIMLGIFIATLIANRRLTRRGGEPWVIVDIGVWAVAVGLVGARFYHVATHLGDYFGEGKNPWIPWEPGSIWALWEGGGAIFGALLGGAFGVFLGCRFLGLRFTTVADAIAPALMIAQTLGRTGNWFNQELFGLPTDMPWGLEIDRPNSVIPVGIADDVLFHPVFLYEGLWNLIGFALILLLTQRVFYQDSHRVVQAKPFWQWGKVLGAYLIWYGLGRFFFESIRLDPSATFLGLRSNMWAALGAVLLGLCIIIVQSKRHKGVEPDLYLPGRRPTPAAEGDDVYSDVEEPLPSNATVTNVKEK